MRNVVIILVVVALFVAGIGIALAQRGGRVGKGVVAIWEDVVEMVGHLGDALGSFLENVAETLRGIGRIRPALP